MNSSPVSHAANEMAQKSMIYKFVREKEYA